MTLQTNRCVQTALCLLWVAGALLPAPAQRDYNQQLQWDRVDVDTFPTPRASERRPDSSDTMTPGREPSIFEQPSRPPRPYDYERPAEEPREKPEERRLNPMSDEDLESWQDKLIDQVLQPKQDDRTSPPGEDRKSWGWLADDVMRQMEEKEAQAREEKEAQDEDREAAERMEDIYGLTDEDTGSLSTPDQDAFSFDVEHEDDAPDEEPYQLRRKTGSDRPEPEDEAANRNRAGRDAGSDWLQMLDAPGASDDDDGSADGQTSMQSMRKSTLSDPVWQADLPEYMQSVQGRRERESAAKAAPARDDTGDQWGGLSSPATPAATVATPLPDYTAGYNLPAAGRTDYNQPMPAAGGGIDRATPQRAGQGSATLPDPVKSAMDPLMNSEGAVRALERQWR